MISFEQLTSQNDPCVVEHCEHCNNDIDTSQLSTALQGNTNLRVLRLYFSWWGTVSEDDAKVLATAISQTKIIKLSLEWESLSPHQHENAANILLTAVRDAAIEELELSLHRPSYQFGSLEVLMECLPKLKTLTINCSKPFNLDPLMRFGLRHVSTLTNLAFSHVRFSTRNMYSLSKGLAKNSSVTTLCLHRCMVDDEGIEAFSDHWSEQSPIHSLDLRDNKISVTGAVQIIHDSSSRLAMESLNLNGNARIGCRGLVVIGLELPRILLKELKLAYCLHGNHSTYRAFQDTNKLLGDILLQSMSENTRLVELEISGKALDYFAYGFREALDFYLVRNKCTPLIMSPSQVLGQASQLSPSLWCHVLAKYAQNANSVFYLLREQPDLWPQINHYGLVTAESSDNDAVTGDEPADSATGDEPADSATGDEEPARKRLRIAIA